MRIAVIGAGIAGVTTAYELARDGHEVSVIEGNDAVAAEASFANAGLLCSALVGLPAVPGGPRRWLGGNPAGSEALRWRPRWHRAEWHWYRGWQRAASLAQPADRQAMQHLAELSAQRRRALTREHGLSHERSDGLLIVHRQGSRPDRRWALLQGNNLSKLTVEAVDADRCRQIEPGLNVSTALAGGLHLPEATVGNCREFAHQLRLVCERAGGVRFHFSSSVAALQPQAGGGVRLVIRPADERSRVGTPARPGSGGEQPAFQPTQPQPLPAALTFDAVVLCTGAQGQCLATAAGLRLPLQPVWGHSVTFRLRDDLHEQALRSAVIEADSGITLTRLGQRLRVAGGWELGGSLRAAEDSDFNALYAALDRWFPLATQRAGAQLWRGARPMLPQDTAVIGPAPMPGVWLQLGHGAHGWTLACGAARLLADQMKGGPCAIDPAPFSAQPWSRR